MEDISTCLYCKQSEFRTIAVFSRPCLEEELFGIDEATYQRELIQCRSCKHFFNRHDYEDMLKASYLSKFREKAYGDALLARYQQIINLPKTESDNQKRVQDLQQLLVKYKFDQSGSLLDIGSGSAVFPGLMAQYGWDASVVDVDPISTSHAAENLGIKTHTGYFLEIPAGEFSPDGYDLVSFNKVLEHVEGETAIEMLRKGGTLLSSQGFIYVELPDGEMAIHKGPDRAEFHLEHFGIFSMISATALISLSGLLPLQVERLIEPSGKCTLKALARRV